MNQVSIPDAFQLALRHHSQGQMQQAEALCNQILAREPNHAGSWHLLGYMAYQGGKVPVAEYFVRGALERSSDYSDAHCTMGMVFQSQGKIDEAIGQYQRAVEIRPAFQEAVNNLGNAYRIKGRLGEAEAILRQLIKTNPKCYPARTNLGVTLKTMGRTDDAIAVYEQILAEDPSRFETMNNLATALLDKRDLSQAISVLEKAIAIRPQSLEIRMNLANALREDGKFEQSSEHCRKALEIKPNLIAARNTIGTNLKDTGRLDEAIATFRGALIYHDDITTQANLLLTITSRGDRPEAILAEARRFNSNHALKLLPAATRFDNAPDRDRPLRVGYVSADFREHSVANFLLPLLESHDKSVVQYACYSNYERAYKHAVKDRIAAGAFSWRDIDGVPDEQVAEWVRQDQIDILVDLSGHTSGGRLLVFARKPAPVQVTAIGYPGTTGLTAIDWRLTDALADPPGRRDRYYSEKLFRLNPTAWCYQPPADAPEVNQRPTHQPVVFGALTNHSKISATTRNLWAHVLRAIPESKLIVKTIGLQEPLVAREMRQEFERLGVDPNRLDLRAKVDKRDQHLRMHHEIDIVLDTFPYNGTTTTCEALWLGVPVVSLVGTDHPARVGLSLLTNVGLPELAADSEDHYVHIAVELAHDRRKLAELRAGLRDQMRTSPLMDGPAYAREVERAYRAMWQSWCDSASTPQPAGAIA